MRLVALVRREIHVLLRSPGMWIALGTFAAVLALGVVLPALAFDNPDPRLGGAFLLGPATDILLPTVAIVYGHGAVAARREIGELTHLLGLPYRRIEIYFGIWLGRVSVVGALTAVGILPAVAVIGLVYGEVPLGPIAGFVAITALAGATYTAVAVAISAMVRTRLRALGIALGGFVIAYALWEPALEGAKLTSVGAARSGWLDRLQAVTPLEAYGRIADAVLPAAPRVELAFTGGELAGQQAAVVGNAGLTTAELIGPLVVLLAWALVPAVAAAVRFDRADLS